MPIEVEGARELARAIREIGDKDLQKALRLANKSAAAVVAVEAQGRAPVRTGWLRNSIRPTATQKGGSVKVGGGKVPYANTIIWGRKSGNVGSPPGNRRGRNPVTGQPFPQEALEARQAEVVEIYQRKVAEVIDAALRSF